MHSPFSKINIPSAMHHASGFMKTSINVVSGALRDISSFASPKIFLENDEYESRLSICRECELFCAHDGRCGSPDVEEKWGCGCYISDHFTQAGIKIPGKSRFRDAHCPLTPPKW